nr:FCH domain only protein 2 [Hymenolepis microstoma]
MKVGLKNTTEFCDFLRELNAMEESYAKGLAKLSKQASLYTASGSFRLWWSLFSVYIDKSISLLGSLESDRLNLWKDVQKYLDELQKKHRTAKEGETSTQEVVHSFQVASVHLQKAKDLYHTRFKEYERVRLNEIHSVRDMEKAETKLKKAQDEYKYSVEKYNNLRLQFVDKMGTSCERFEEMEITHLTRMCEFFGRFVEILVRSRSAQVTLAKEFNQRQLVEVTPKNLLLNMVEERGTGSKEPPPAEFEDVEVAAAFNNDLPRVVSESGGVTSKSSTPCPPTHLTSDSNSLRAASALPAFGNQESPMANHQGTLDPSWQSSLNEISGTHSTALGRRAGILFQRRNRQNSSGLETDNASVNSSGSTPGSFAQKLANVRNLARIPRKTSNSPNEITSKAFQSSAVNHPKVDEEGYNIRPENPWATGHSRSPSSSGSSGSSSPSEKTFKGIKVKIRPLGDLSPGAVEPTSPKTAANLPSPFGFVMSRDFRRPHTSVDIPFGSTGPFPPEARSSSVATAPLVPMLPPPPGQDTVSRRRNARAPLKRGEGSLCSFESSMAHSIATLGDDEPFNPFGLPTSDESTPTPNTVNSWDAIFNNSDGSEPTPKAQDSWEAVFKTAQNDTSNETYDRLIDLHDDNLDSKKAEEVTPLPESTPSERKVCHAPLAALEDDDASTATSPHFSQLPPPTLPRFSTEPRALPPPQPPLPIAIALTETWRAQFPNGGGSSFTNSERPAQSLFGQVTLAVAREDLRLLTQKASLKPLLLIFSRAERMRKVQATFSGVSVQLEDGEETRYRVTIPGDLLYHYLVETQSEAADEEYTRLSLLDYAIESNGVPPPITMCTFWRCEKENTDFRLDYFVQWPKWNVSSSPLDNDDTGSSEISCQDLRVNLLVDGGVIRMQSRPLGTWNSEQTRASWSIPLTHTAESQPHLHPGVDVSGNIRAKFFLTNGPGTPQPVALQFCRDGGCLPSGALLSLGSESLSGGVAGVGYRLTMCKYRLLGDRYFCDPPMPLGGMTKCLPLLSPSSSRAQSSN